TIEGIAFDGFTTRFANQSHQLFSTHALRSRRTCVVIDLLFDHSTIEVVSAKTQRNLRDLRREHLPVRFYVREIVQYEPANGNLANVEHAGGLRQMLQGRIVGMKSEWNKGLKALSFILQCAELQQMVDPVLIIFNVTI